jgi:capsule polysaccharide export protein KpsE/RkpR
MIARPSEPDEATHPRVWIAVLTVFVLSFALLGIGTLLLASVREHANL